MKYCININGKIYEKRQMKVMTSDNSFRLKYSLNASNVWSITWQTWISSFYYIDIFKYHTVNIIAAVWYQVNLTSYDIFKLKYEGASALSPYPCYV